MLPGMQKESTGIIKEKYSTGTVWALVSEQYASTVDVVDERVLGSKTTII